MVFRSKLINSFWYRAENLKHYQNQATKIQKINYYLIFSKCNISQRDNRQKIFIMIVMKSYFIID